MCVSQITNRNSFNVRKFFQMASSPQPHNQKHGLIVIDIHLDWRDRSIGVIDFISEPFSPKMKRFAVLQRATDRKIEQNDDNNCVFLMFFFALCGASRHFGAQQYCLFNFVLSHHIPNIFFSSRLYLYCYLYLIVMNIILLAHTEPQVKMCIFFSFIRPS